MIGWNFPSNGGGAINGVADSGVEIFRGKEIPSLAREICQNSLDAAINEKSAVTVEFQRYEVTPKDIPDVQGFMRVLKACLAFWTGKSEKTETFIRQAILKLKSSSAVLRISDFNTTGLAEPFNYRAMIGWNTLTKINGGAIKSDDKAGNFGIGKNALFANSFLRMIFYRTLNTKGERAAQAVAKLVSFDLDTWNIASGTGYYGETQGNMPVKNISELDKIYKRTKRGTDVFIYSFNGGKTWEEELTNALIENFLVSIYRDKLRVKVQGREINKATLGAVVKENAANYYKILTGDNAVKTFATDFHGLGKLKLGVLVDPNAKLNRRVLIVRKSGMKLFELDRFPRTLNFTAILELEGDKLNAFFRHMETPDHTNWEPTRHPTYPLKAKQYLAELKSWVRDTISKLSEENISDEIEVPGIITPNNDSDPTPPIIFDTKKPPRNPPQKPPKPPCPPKPPKPPKGDKGLACEKIRVIKVGDKSYRLILKVSRNVLRGRIAISAVGESNSKEKLFVMRVASFSENIQIMTVDEEITFRKLRGKVDVRINFELTDDKNYALGVDVYED